MTAPDFTDAERYRLAFIERAAPAPESFDATAALQRLAKLAEALEQEGRHEEAQAKQLGKSVTAESWWGSSAASLDAAKRIRDAIEQP